MEKEPWLTVPNAMVEYVLQDLPGDMKLRFVICRGVDDTSTLSFMDESVPPGVFVITAEWEQVQPINGKVLSLCGGTDYFLIVNGAYIARFMNQHTTEHNHCTILFKRLGRR